MDIKLNTTGSGKPQKSLKKKGSMDKNIQNSNGYSGFSFNFSTKMKVKAVVAKTRKKSAISESKTSSSVSTTSSSPAVGQYVKSPEFFSHKLKDDNFNTSDGLTLNITTGNEDDQIKAAAKISVKKMNRKERQEMSLAKRAEAYKKLEMSLNLSQNNFRKKKEQPIKKSSKVEPIVEVPVVEVNPAKEISAKENTKQIKSLFSKNPVVPTVGERLIKPVKETLFTGAAMKTLGLHDHLVKTLADILHITELTTVQQRAVPVILSGKDVLVRSQTGSGKTLAYALPIVQKLQEIRPKLSRNGGIQALIIVPTRELALQSYELLLKMLKPFTWIVPGYITGGEKRKAEKARLRKGINILVATPGRLVDHLLHTESFKLNKIKWLILDEADRLYELSYKNDVQKIVDAIKGSNDSLEDFDIRSDQKEYLKEEVNLQSVLLSATLTPALRELAAFTLKDPTYIDTSDIPRGNAVKLSSFDDPIDDANIVIPSTISQTYMLVPPKLRLVTLSGLLALEAKHAKVLVFLATNHLVDFHYDLMVEILTKKVIDADDELEIDGKKSDDDDDLEFGDNEDNQLDMSKFHRYTEGEKDDPILPGVKLFKLHGALTQLERSTVFKELKNVKNCILLTTDVAARGIDLPAVDLVIQYSPPQNLADYVHRVGRTARAGRTGRAILFLAPNEVDFIKILEDKRIRISQEKSDKYLKGVVTSSTTEFTTEECAAKLQAKFENLIADDQEMYEKAGKAFVSWLKFLSTFPRNMRQIFNVKSVHMGHYAKSLGLREPPKSVVQVHNAPEPPLPSNRLSYRETTDRKKPIAKGTFKRPNPANLHSNQNMSKALRLSALEFDSGLPPLKRKKK